MSYDVSLVDGDGNIVEVVPHQEGGIIDMNSSSFATMSVTYNYAKFFYDSLDEKDGLKWLNRTLAKDTIIRLEYAIERLNGNASDDYWKATPGNAKHALKVLLAWAKQYPYATFKVI